MLVVARNGPHKARLKRELGADFLVVVSGESLVGVGVREVFLQDGWSNHNRFVEDYKWLSAICHTRSVDGSNPAPVRYRLPNEIR